MPIKPKELVVGRFWKKQNEDGYPYHRGYIDLGVLGRIMVHLEASPKRPGKTGDSDLSMVIDVTQTPLGMIAVISEKLQEALYEDKDNDGSQGNR